MAAGWNHNNHYHSVLLEAIPPQCQRALDVGCGLGEFAREVASRSNEVDAIDRSAQVIQRAKDLNRDITNIHFIAGDFMQYPLEPNTYDFVSGLALLHHLPLTDGIQRMKSALRPNGVLAILGLYKERIIDLPHSVLAALVNQIYLRIKNADDEPQAPIADPNMTLPEIRSAVSRLLPGASFRTHLLWRYSLIWRKP